MTTRSSEYGPAALRQDRGAAGIVGALVAIPAAVALRLFLQEVVFRRLDDS